jgi:hypothetical protein
MYQQLAGHQRHEVVWSGVCSPSEACVEQALKQIWASATALWWLLTW